MKVNRVKYVPGEGLTTIKETGVAFLTEAIEQIDFADVISGVLITLSDDGTVNIISDGDDMIVVMGLLAAAQSDTANRYHGIPVDAGDDDEGVDE